MKQRTRVEQLRAVAWMSTRSRLHFATLEEAENKTNNAGITSVDRSTKATLTLTVPGCVLSRLQKIYHPQV